MSEQPERTGFVDKCGVGILDGDIVEHDSGRICNGRYGLVVFAIDDWSIQDNEGALDMPLEGNTDQLKVVGNVREKPGLLEEFV